MDYLLSSKSPGFVSTRRRCRARGSITVVVYMVLLQSEQYRSREEERAVRRHGSLQVPSSSQSYVFLDGRIRTDRDGSVVPLLQFYRLLSSIFFFHIALCICKACLDQDLADSLLARQRSQPQTIKIERLGALSGPGSFAEAQTKQPRADG